MTTNIRLNGLSVRSSMPFGSRFNNKRAMRRTDSPKVMSLIGCYKESGFTSHRPVIEGHINPRISARYSMPGDDVLFAGLTDIPAQENDWCCGINSSARFLSMLGKPLNDYRKYHNSAPKHHLAHKETGPGTKWLLRHMERDNQTQGLNVWSNMTNDWHSQKYAIDRSIAAGRPVMVLLEVSGRCLHWVTLIGRDKNSCGDYLAINTNGLFVTIDGGEEGLRRRMNLDGHIVHKVPMRDDRIACFNSIIAEAGPLRNHAGGLERCAHRSSHLDGNRNEILNVLDSAGEVVLDFFDLIPDGAKAAGDGIETAAKAVGNGVESGVKAAGDGIETAAKAVGNGVESAAKAVGDFFKSIF